MISKSISLVMSSSRENNENIFMCKNTSKGYLSSLVNNLGCSLKMLVRSSFCRKHFILDERWLIVHHK